MRAFIFLSMLLSTFSLQADTMEHYMNISNAIPQMEMKADPQAQAWARSARNVLIITDESIAETLLQANELAKSQGKPLFCLPPGTALNAVTLNGIILETYRTISSQQSDKDKMTVSQVAWLGVTKKYPCEADAHGKQMEHMAALLTH
ncbi:phosphatase [Legionella clemsonensis]|nr:phosphatase [Legionella clemsonensis]